MKYSIFNVFIFFNQTFSVIKTCTIIWIKLLCSSFFTIYWLFFREEKNTMLKFVQNTVKYLGNKKQINNKTLSGYVMIGDFSCLPFKGVCGIGQYLNTTEKMQKKRTLLIWKTGCILGYTTVEQYGTTLGKLSSHWYLNT